MDPQSSAVRPDDEGRSDLEALRAWAAGELPEAERAPFERRLIDDPELGALADAWSDVVRVTDAALAAEASAPTSRTRFEDIERRLDAEESPFVHAFPRRVAAAVLIGLVAGGGLLASIAGGPAPRPVVTLESIPRVADAPPMNPATDALVARLLDYQPIADGSIAWIDTIEEGRAIADASGRLLLLWGIHPTCPFCKRMRETTLLEADVHDALESYVPAQIDVMRSNRYATLNPMERGFPIFEVVTADLDVLHTFFSYQSEEDFIRELQRGLAERGDAQVLDWDRLPEVAGVLGEARALEREGRLGAALARYQALVDLGGGHSLSRAGERGVRRLAAVANRYLELAESNADPARVLAGAAAEFRGSAYAADFERVAAAARAADAFPRITRGR